MAIVEGPLKRVSLAEQAYERLREAIAAGRLGPGQRLIERQLCDELGVSRTPLREAMIRLEHDGLLTTRPAGGLVVTSVDEKEAEEIWAIRLPLEGYAAGLAAANRDVGELEELRDTLQIQRIHLAEMDRGRLAEVNDRFHSVLYAASKRRRLTELIDRYRRDANEFHVYEVYSEAELLDGLNDHERLLVGVEAQDVALAEQLLREHLLRGQKVLREKRVHRDVTTSAKSEE